MNLMPVPVLDGEHIFIMALEGAGPPATSARPSKRRWRGLFAVILMLIVTVSITISRESLDERLMPWR